MYDLAIIGSGAAGIAAVKQALKRRLKTVLIDRNQFSFGGTCVNKGCIPTKFFLRHAEESKTWEEIFVAKESLVTAIREPLLAYLEKQGVLICWGDAFFLNEHTLKVNEDTIEAKYIIIATGSSPRRILEGPNVIFAEELFQSATVPQRFLIVGGGYIGIEMASLLNAVKKEVTVIEQEEWILPIFDRALSQRAQVSFAKHGIKIITSQDIHSFDWKGFDMVLLSVGRQPNSAELNCEMAGVAVDEKGWIKTNARLCTTASHIYACGDVIGKSLLAYVAERQAEVCVDAIAGIIHQEDYWPVPECVFSIPQIAKVGMTEKELQEANITYRVIQTSFMRFSSAYVYDDKEGFLKILVDSKAHIVGASVISRHAGELINFLALCVKYALTVEQLRACTFVHPTISEILALALKDA